MFSFGHCPNEGGGGELIAQPDEMLIISHHFPSQIQRNIVLCYARGGVTILWKFFIKPYYFLKDGFPYVRGSHVLSGAEDEVQWVRRAASLKLGPRLLVVIYVLIWWSVKRCDKNREGGCQGAKWVGQYLMPPQTWAGWECGQNVCSIASHLTCITPRAMGCGWALLPLRKMSLDSWLFHSFKLLCHCYRVKIDTPQLCGGNYKVSR